MLKSLSKLSFHITESEYRNLPYLSYSALARYEKNGFSIIPKLYEKQESDSITFGSMVDTLVTEGLEAFHNKFAIAKFDLPTESILKVTDALFDLMLRDNISNINDVSDDLILEACNLVEYNTRLKDSTRVDKIRKEGTAYCDMKLHLNNRILVSNEMYQEAIATVSELKNHPLIGKYFGESSGDIEFLYQQKFISVIDNIPLKCMFDLIIVNHLTKTITGIDLKTTSAPEYDFPKKYLENRYDIQSRLYTTILQQVISNDEYFKYFTIQGFGFIVINKISRNPLLFVDDKFYVKPDIELVFSSGRKSILRNPIRIAAELKRYLDTNVKVPDGINTTSSNKIYERLALL